MVTVRRLLSLEVEMVEEGKQSDGEVERRNLLRKMQIRLSEGWWFEFRVSALLSSTTSQVVTIVGVPQPQLTLTTPTEMIQLIIFNFQTSIARLSRLWLSWFDQV
jgi:hypothetical protein